MLRTRRIDSDHWMVRKQATGTDRASGSVPRPRRNGMVRCKVRANHHDVAIAAKEAWMAFELLLEARNRVLKGYRDRLLGYHEHAGLMSNRWTEPGRI